MSRDYFLPGLVVAGAMVIAWFMVWLTRQFLEWLHIDIDLDLRDEGEDDWW